VNRELILLAASRKYGKYCVAGVDTQTGQWLRLVSNDSDSHYAIDPKDLVMDNGAQASKLDIVRIQITDRAISYFQSENYVIRRNTPWQFAGKATIADVIAVHPPNRSEFIFYDTSRRISKQFYTGLQFKQIHSLLLISPEQAQVEIMEQEDKRRVTLHLRYQGNDYEPLPVTDLEFCALCDKLRPGLYPMRKHGIMLCSVGECYEKEQFHYKLVAGIMLEDEKPGKDH